MKNYWISIQDQLPKDGQLVIAYDDRMHHCRYDRGQFYRHTEASSNDRIINSYYDKITHWQPELDPPKTSSTPLLGDRAERLSISETFAKLRELGMGEYWDKIKCVCSELGKSKCELNCKEYDE